MANAKKAVNDKPQAQAEEFNNEEQINVVAPEVVKTKKNLEKPVEEFEFRDRLYVLKSKARPILFTIPSRHSAAKPLLYFDKELRKPREIRYATNQESPLVDEQKGTVTLGKIGFRDGILSVPAHEVALQKLLSLYHPLKDKVYEEYNAIQESIDELDSLELEFEALSIAKTLNIDELEAILRTEKGSKVSNLTSSELKRDALLMAKKKPALFIELANDENVHLRNVGIKAVEGRILRLSQDQRTFHFVENDRKLMTVPFNEHPYSALAAWFKTDEGLDVLRYIEKALK
jgi:hypothetical protein